MNTNVGVGFVDPSVQWLDNAGVVLSGGSVEFFLAGTTTHVNTFSDQALTAANLNPVPLDAAGRATIYLTPVNGTTVGIAVKYTLRTSAGAIVRTVDNVTLPAAVAGANLTGAVVGYGPTTTLSDNGNTITPIHNIHLVQPEGIAADQIDTINITGLPDGALLILGNSIPSSALTVRSGIGNVLLAGAADAVLQTAQDRITLVRQGGNFVEVSRSLGAAAAPEFNKAVTQGRLTVQSGVPVPSGDVSGATVYFTPYKGNVIALPPTTGSVFSMVVFGQTSIAVPAGADTVYDVFGFNNAGLLALELVAWASLNTRAVALINTGGIYLKSTDQTRKYLGSVATISNTVSDTFQFRHVWNYYNRMERALRKTDPTPSWVYSSAVWRAANGDSNNNVSTCVGVSEEACLVSVYGYGVASAAQLYCAVGLGVESTITPSSSGALIIQPGNAAIVGELMPMFSSYPVMPPIGRTRWFWLEFGNAAGTTWLGTGAGPAATVQAGLMGHVWA